MPRPNVEIMQSSAEGTHEAAPKAGMSVTDSRSMSISSTPAETYPEKSTPSPKPVSPTNLTQASTGGDTGPKIGTASCWNTLQSIQDTIVETSKAAKASRLSSEYGSGQSAGPVQGRMNETIGVAKIGAATCWSKMSKMAWDLALPDVDSNKHSADVKSSTNPTGMPNVTGETHVERLKNKAALSVTAPELPSSTVDEDGLAVEVIENIDSL
mmetsp:Transcript_39372/g.95299  ORF Transcript_39372/g.95299 Transcript_39372/m.95299 type:complete len:212 (+) Transcript_39372:171-806(+)|eukprot:CAMPEP_0113641730 /NCGR_PEP_ID=MMETSP0017_2-20120614/21914_1 /TAXON_ID=2856 /ORGANISM="Cylindrotheca closterium" /LENGTH=211 /DNA_ID=CAMNT_0000553101 /DNA_START=86 /DNA_END=721 /DNA_ORIENTATION=+ /assembly_acc=CAM_ASM_000147